MRHPCRIRSRDGGRARAIRECRYAWLKAGHRSRAVLWRADEFLLLAFLWEEPTYKKNVLTYSNHVVTSVAESSAASAQSTPQRHLSAPLRVAVPSARNQLDRRTALAGSGTVWRHGCRHRASRDGFTACPGTGQGSAPSTNRLDQPPRPTASTNRLDQSPIEHPPSATPTNRPHPSRNRTKASKQSRHRPTTARPLLCGIYAVPLARP